MREPGIGSAQDCRKLYLCITTAEHMVRNKNGAPFNKEQYYREPDQYEPVFQDTILPYSTVIVNCMYWDARFPKLFTQDDIHRHVMQGHDRLLGVCDITCDADGSVPTRLFTSIEHPFFVYNALTEKTSSCLDDPGVLFHAVDHLPSELPREASEHFGNCLLQFLPAMVAARAPEACGQGDTASWPAAMRGAVIAEGGQLSREYEYIQQLRSAYERSDSEEAAMAKDRGGRTSGPHSVQAPPACVTLDLGGHLFDSMFINKVCDLVESQRGRVQITNIDVGSSVGDTSRASILVMAHTQEALDKIVGMIFSAANEAKVSFRRTGADRDGASIPAEAQRSILLLGSGFVSGPVIEYLLRRPENVVTVASIQRSELENFAQLFGARCQPQFLDVLSEDAEMAALREDLVKRSDVIVSLVPATMHVGMAKLAIKHKTHMVTASYVSEQMQSLDKDARDAGVLIINEVGLDPGIDHLGAMKMIHHATSSPGCRVLKFSSLCGGLPAPEAAGSSPLGYKFSWSPKGVLLASRNSAKWMQDGKLCEVPGSELFASGKPMTLNNALAFDVLPNRDSTAFAELYGMPEVPTFFRGTLRYRGYCERMIAVARLGLLELGPVEQLLPLKEKSPTRRQWFAQLLGCVADDDTMLDAAMSERLGSGSDAEVGKEFIGWLGLLSDEALPQALAENPIDVTTALLNRAEMLYQPGERDMVAMYHELVVERSDGAIERHTATLIEYAEPHGVTAMAKTVGITAAIAAQLVLDNPAPFGVGVQRPLTKVWYEPMLRILEGEGIRMEERCEIVRGASKL
eukprot:CAMPEP_0177393224 /NCGR_PEP_ID=MMETSP0368-20130122/54833_1 /TAXON_ID=447022 ORGANISM="Scrippsiella hangoei-like, Strain SHHI-4" /NCGR_SAMPLE_ID=MMETSP0368 /ASSEMBLY_ACC=CAM_ASM_000363 /LENGTH=801 /DNA_ID=CAMNT_0018859385 /DNA_START=3 /DNA_END=2408 /DNA_ORIENTATION=-